MLTVTSRFDKNHDLTNLLLDNYFKEKIEAAQGGWRRVASTAILNGKLPLELKN